MEALKSYAHYRSIRFYLEIVFWLLVLAAMFFGAAGTVFYWEAWVYLILLAVSTVFVTAYFLRYDPEFLESRMKVKEKVALQKKIVGLFYPIFIFFLILPGLDRRFGWSHVPFLIVILSDLIFLMCYYGIFLVFKENRYASRIIEVVEGQKVITSGPYRIVRHPMYLASILMWGITPLALGSLWGVVFVFFLVVFLVARIINEEKVLIKELEGYLDYTKKTRYRLVPGIW